MSNTLNGTFDQILAQEGLAAFKAGLAPITAFSTNFEAEARQKGESVITRLITGMSAGDFAGDYETGDTTLSAVTVTLDQQKFRSFHLTDVEASKTPIDVSIMQAREAAYSVAKSVVLYAWSLVTNANYSTAAFTGAASGFDSDDVIDVAGVCDDANMPEENRCLILARAYHTALLKDSAIKATYASGSSDALREGVSGRVANFDVYKSTIVPGNSENLTGFAGHPSGLAIAIRPVRPQSNSAIESYEEAVDPQSGVRLGYVRWYSPKTGKMWGRFEALFGASKGNANGIKRIVSA